jgi:hypothetical protein
MRVQIQELLGDGGHLVKSSEIPNKEGFQMLPLLADNASDRNLSFANARIQEQVSKRLPAALSALTDRPFGSQCTFILKMRLSASTRGGDRLIGNTFSKCTDTDPDATISFVLDVFELENVKEQSHTTIKLSKK